jgi:hypothetical protein
VQSQISLSLSSHGWLCNTVEEIEPLGMEVLRKYLKLSVRAIGPLLPPAALKKQILVLFFWLQYIQKTCR